jgi:hypothetical protein
MWKKITASEFEKFIQADKSWEVGDLPSYNEIIKGLNRDVVNRSRGCRVNRYRTLQNNIWLFRAVCTGETYTVSLQALDTDGDPKTPKDLKIKCTCPHWKWGGPDYNAYKGDYLYKNPMSDLSFPDKRDPNLENKLCKHAYAVLDSARSYLVDWSTSEEQTIQQQEVEEEQRVQERTRRKDQERGRQKMRQDERKRDRDEDRRRQQPERRDDTRRREDERREQRERLEEVAPEQARPRRDVGEDY